jgi:ribosomal-protein-alanine N-acetyltransferase
MMDIALPGLYSSRLILRLAKPQDVSAILRYYQDNRGHLEPFEPQRDRGFYSEIYWDWVVRDRMADFWADRSFKLFLFKQESPQSIIGSVNFSYFLRGIAQSCILGYSLAYSEQGQGYMTEALEVAIAYVFEELNFHRVIAAYMPHNRQSGNVLKRLGFKVEGYAYDYLMIQNAWQDHILTSLINENWQAKQL